jgi:hypothetical protein
MKNSLKAFALILLSGSLAACGGVTSAPAASSGGAASIPSASSSNPTIEGLEFTLSYGHYKVSRYTGTATTVNIPSTYRDIPVTEIGIGSFALCDSLVAVSIPSSVTNIDEDAFEACPALTTVKISSSLTTLGSNVFFGCTALKFFDFVGNSNYSINPERNIILSGNGTKIVAWAPGALSFVIPNTVIGIEESVFYDCTACASVSIPATLAQIEKGSFGNLFSLKSFDFAGNSTYTTNPEKTLIMNADGTEIVAVAKGLSSIVIPSTCTSIFSGAFSDCPSLVSVRIPSSVTSIEAWTFSNCSALTTLSLPDSLTSLGDDAFRNCGALTSLSLPDSLTSIGKDAFQNCIGLKSVILPSALTSIAHNSFEGCSNVKSFLAAHESVADVY